MKARTRISNYLLLTTIFLLASCESMDIDLFAKPPKKLEGERVNVLESNFVTSEVKNFPASHLPAINFADMKVKEINGFSGDFEKIAYAFGKNYLVGNNAIITSDYKISLNNKYSKKESILVNDKIYYSNDNNAKAYDLNGKLIWEYNFDYTIKSKPVIIYDQICYQLINFNMVCLNNNIGSPTTVIDDPSNEIVAESKVGVFKDNNNLIFSSKDGAVKAINLVSKEQSWEFNSANKFDNSGLVFYNLSVNPIIDNEVIYFANFANGVFAINKNTGKEIWTKSLKKVTAMNKFSNYLSVIDVAGNINILDAESGKLLLNKKLDKSSSEILLSLPTKNGVLVIYKSGIVDIINYEKLNQKTYYDFKESLVDYLMHGDYLYISSNEKIFQINLK